MLAALQARQVSDRARLNPRSELTAYLKSTLEQTDDVVGWWGVSIYIELAYLQFYKALYFAAPPITIPDTITHG